MLRNNRGQLAIIEIVVVVVIIVALAYFLIPKYIGSAGQGVKNGGPPTPMERANGVECMTNLSQVRQAIGMYQQSNEKAPTALSDLSSVGVTGSISKCPITGTPYSYDPSQGRVWCTTPGHEKY